MKNKKFKISDLVGNELKTSMSKNVLRIYKSNGNRINFKIKYKHSKNYDRELKLDDNNNFDTANDFINMFENKDIEKIKIINKKDGIDILLINNI